jgi:hypothetical protein
MTSRIKASISVPVSSQIKSIDMGLYTQPLVRGWVGKVTCKVDRHSGLYAEVVLERSGGGLGEGAL